MADPNAKRDSALQDIARQLKDLNRLLDTINNNMVAISKIFEPKDNKSPYTMQHLPMLDRLHGDMGLSAWWLRSEQRQNIMNTPDE